MHNTGSLFRTAECLGVAELYLVGTTPTPIDRFGRKRQDFAKVSLGAEDIIPWRYYPDISAALSGLQEKGMSVYALEQSDDSINLPAVRKSSLMGEFIALVVGNEIDGVSAQVLQSAHGVIEIPQQGTKESFNVSVAGAIALYHLRYCV